MSNKAVLFGLPIWGLFCILLVVWGGVTAAIWFVCSDSSKSGTFGDTFGAVNSLFSGLAFLGILYTVTQQKNQFQKQTFEDNFFRMLELHNSLVSELDVTFKEERGTEITRHGREVLLGYYTVLKKKFSTIHVVEMEIADPECILCDIDKVYLPFFDEAKPRLGQYFRFLYNVVKFTAENAPSNKQDYLSKDPTIQSLGHPAAHPSH